MKISALDTARLFVVLLIIAAPQKLFAETSIGPLFDVGHSLGETAIAARYDYRPLRLGAQALLWDGSRGVNGSLGADFNAGYGPVDIDLGGAYILRKSRINGTRLNFSLGAAVNFWKLRIQYTHFSNGNGIFKWEKGRPNQGWNFLGIMYRF